MEPDPLGGVCPLSVQRPLMVHRWEQLTFLHWSLEPAVVQRLLPPGLTVDTHGGLAWVGLVPFLMRLRPPGLPEPPWLGRFCETNVRTYVRDRHGRQGVWFFSLEASRLPAVVMARATYRLPYCWASMRLERRPDRVTYSTARRWPRPRGCAAGGTVVVHPGTAIPPAEVTDLEHFLTARWRLFNLAPGGALVVSDAEHPPWPLQRAVVERCEDSLVRAAGLPEPVGAPLVHYSPGVEVRIGPPRRVR